MNKEKDDEWIEVEGCGDCGESYCDHCTYKKELAAAEKARAVAENPCKACGGSGIEKVRTDHRDLAN